MRTIKRIQRPRRRWWVNHRLRLRQELTSAIIANWDSKIFFFLLFIFCFYYWTVQYTLTQSALLFFFIRKVLLTQSEAVVIGFSLSDWLSALTLSIQTGTCLTNKTNPHASTDLPSPRAMHTYRLTSTPAAHTRCARTYCRAFWNNLFLARAPFPPRHCTQAQSVRLPKWHK